MKKALLVDPQTLTVFRKIETDEPTRAELLMQIIYLVRYNSYVSR